MHAQLRRCNKLELFSVAKRYLVLISRICAAVVGCDRADRLRQCLCLCLFEAGAARRRHLRDVQLQVPLRVYTRDGRLMAAIGEQRRIPVRYDQLPPKLIQAFLATEDDRFFPASRRRLAGYFARGAREPRAGGIRQGASTITMQVARDMFLTPRRDMKRKMSEIYISLLMETEFTKEEIFSLYVNKIFLGQRAYGVAAPPRKCISARRLDQLDHRRNGDARRNSDRPLDVNPVASAEAATIRRAHVLGRMLELNYITPAEFEAAKRQPMESRLHGPSIEVDAPYVAEMVRNEMQAKYGDSIYTAGYRVFTTIDSHLEAAATVALRTGLLEYDRRHGWRGATAKVDLSKAASPAYLEAELEKIPVRSAACGPPSCRRSRRRAPGSTSRAWARSIFPGRSCRGRGASCPTKRWTARPPRHRRSLARGDVIYTVGNSPESLQFVQVPEAQSALVALDPKDGAVVALVGGFDFFQSKFNRVTQARRQPGFGVQAFRICGGVRQGVHAGQHRRWMRPSWSMKPAWNRPGGRRNSKTISPGPFDLREALVHSRNLVSIRLMREIGGDYTWNYVQRFGFDKSQLPKDLTLAVGTAEFSPLQVVVGYSTFANGGFRVTPYYIDRIEDAGGKTTVQANPSLACFECGRPRRIPGSAKAAARRTGCSSWRRRGDGKSLIPAKDLAPQVIRPQVAYLLSDMMADVIRRGTGVGARGAQPRRSGRQDGHHQRFSRCLVLRLQRRSGGHRLDRVRSGPLAGRRRARRARVAAYLGIFHARGARRAPAAHVPDARRHRDRAHFAGNGLARRSADNPNGIMEKFIEGNLPKSEVLRRAEQFESHERRRQAALYRQPCPRNIRSVPKICAALWLRRPRASWPSTASRISCRPSARPPTGSA